MIYTLTLNPSLDYVMHLDSFQKSFVNRSTKEEIFPGGKGVNVSIVLNNLKIPNIALGFCGGDTGGIFENLLKKMQVRSDFVRLKEGRTRINVKIKSKEETEVNGAGPVITKDDMDNLLKKLKCIEDGDILVLSGSPGPFQGGDVYKDISLSVKEKNVRIIVDTTGQFLINSLSVNPFLVKPNIFELEEIFQKSITGLKEVEESARALCKMGAQNVLVSLGDKGALLCCDNGDVITKNAPSGKAVNTTGAGDSMIAGFIASYVNGGNYDSCLNMGISAGSATAFSSSLACYDKIMEIYTNITGI